MSAPTVHTPISLLLTNKRRVNALKKLGIITVRDALEYYPFRVTDPVPVHPLAQLRFGEKMACPLTVRSVHVSSMNTRSGYRLEVLADDAQFASEHNTQPRRATLVFFSHRKSYVDWMSHRLQANMTIVIAGEPSTFNDRLQFTHPELLTVREKEQTTTHGDVDSLQEGLARVCRPRPVYHANASISSERIHETILSLLYMLAGIDTVTQSQHDESPSMQSLFSADANARARLAQAIPDIIPEPIRAEHQYLHRAQALCEIHDPNSVPAFHQAIATMRYEEALICQCSLLMARRAQDSRTAYPCTKSELRQTYINDLPFSLTDGQREVIDTICADMSKHHPMQRLLQGEVGSGKTVVAIAAMLQAVGSGYQAVLVAPTQVLAEQHFHSIESALGTQVPVLLLTGGMRLAQRRKVLATAASGEPCIIVATHAAFSKSFQAPRLALVVIDEQHRFGVEQRETLREKSEQDPHLLVMTATPIPRTAAMTWFGDLDISWLTELPGGRKPIRTFVVPESNGQLMGQMFALVRQRIDAGERAYVVCPRIEESTDTDTAQEDATDTQLLDIDMVGEEDATRPPLHAVSEIAARLRSLPQFAGVQFCTLTGRDDDATKQEVMAQFAQGDTPIMVATTVIEVGVDVPQASCIVIFDADRYGLSQLHQLRGRVGRGGTHSWAFLVSQAPDDSIAQERLEVIEGSLDGAVIAQKDLELRGAGDVLGDAQSGGKSSLKLLRVVKDASLIVTARDDARQILDDDPQLSDHIELAGAVLDFTRGNESYLMSN